MVSMADFVERKLDLGRVVRETFGVLARQPLMVFGMTLVLGAGPALLNLYFQRQDMSAAVTGFGNLVSPFFWFRILIMAFVGSFLEVCLFFVAFSEVSGRKASLSEVMTNGAKFFLPLFAVNVMSLVAIWIGMILLVVPGVMLALAWCVAGPTLVVERTGITQVFGRSAQLTRNNRWRILGLFLIFFVIVIVIEAALGVFSLAGGGMGGVLFSPFRLVFFALISTVSNAISYVGLGVLYANLRELKEGVGGESLAAVFD